MATTTHIITDPQPKSNNTLINICLETLSYACEKPINVKDNFIFILLVVLHINLNATLFYNATSFLLASRLLLVRSISLLEPAVQTHVI